MKKILLLGISLVIGACSFSQDAVNWSFSVKKINDKTFELHCTASIGAGWHIYSQFTPDGGPVATVVKLTPNAILTTEGNVKEVGKLEEHHEPLFGVDVKQFSGSVDFVQQVKLKLAVKTKLTGSVKYMACNDSQCLPPRELQFNVALQ